MDFARIYNAIDGSLWDTVKEWATTAEERLQKQPRVASDIEETLARYIESNDWPKHFTMCDRLLEGSFGETIIALIRACMLRPELIQQLTDDGSYPRCSGLIYQLHLRYAHRYRTAIYQTEMRSERYAWRNIRVNAFRKHGVEFLGITFARNDGEEFYIEAAKKQIAEKWSPVMGIGLDTEETEEGEPC